MTKDGTIRRAIDFHESDKLAEKSLKALVLEAVKLNKSGRKTSRMAAKLHYRSGDGSA